MKLLRVLQERKLRPVGGDAEVPFDARFDRRDQPRPREPRSRRSAFARTSTTGSTSSQIDVPPLRARPGDSCSSRSTSSSRSRRDGKRAPRLRDDAARKLIAYDWPGNVRELQNCIERAMALGEATAITLEDLPETIRDSTRHRRRLPRAGRMS